VTCTGDRSSQWRSGHPADSAAAAETGIVFHRTDLEGFPIEASGRNVARVSYATSLMKKGVLISTLSTCFPHLPESASTMPSLTG